jgi:hypothetical protein
MRKSKEIENQVGVLYRLDRKATCRQAQGAEKSDKVLPAEVEMMRR